MRKTRLVILPGVRSITQIGCLLLFLACPSIAFKGQEKRDIEPICKVHELKYWWLPFDTGEGENITESQKSMVFQQCQNEEDIGMIKVRNMTMDYIHILSNEDVTPNILNVDLKSKTINLSLPSSTSSSRLKIGQLCSNLDKQDNLTLNLPLTIDSRKSCYLMENFFQNNAMNEILVSKYLKQIEITLDSEKDKKSEHISRKKAFKNNEYQHSMPLKHKVYIQTRATGPPCSVNSISHEINTPNRRNNPYRRNNFEKRKHFGRQEDSVIHLNKNTKRQASATNQPLKIVSGRRGSQKHFVSDLKMRQSNLQDRAIFEKISVSRNDKNIKILSLGKRVTTENQHERDVTTRLIFPVEPRIQNSYHAVPIVISMPNDKRFEFSYRTKLPSRDIYTQSCNSRNLINYETLKMNKTQIRFISEARQKRQERSTFMQQSHLERQNRLNDWRQGIQTLRYSIKHIRNSDTKSLSFQKHSKADHKQNEIEQQKKAEFYNERNIRGTKHIADKQDFALDKSTFFRESQRWETLSQHTKNIDTEEIISDKRRIVRSSENRVTTERRLIANKLQRDVNQGRDISNWPLLASRTLKSISSTVRCIQCRNERNNHLQLNQRRSLQSIKNNAIDYKVPFPVFSNHRLITNQKPSRTDNLIIGRQNREMLDDKHTFDRRQSLVSSEHRGIISERRTTEINNVRDYQERMETDMSQVLKIAIQQIVLADPKIINFFRSRWENYNNEQIRQNTLKQSRQYDTRLTKVTERSLIPGLLKTEISKKLLLRDIKSREDLHYRRNSHVGERISDRRYSVIYIERKGAANGRRTTDVSRFSRDILEQRTSLNKRQQLLQMTAQHSTAQSKLSTRRRRELFLEYQITEMRSTSEHTIHRNGVVARNLGRQLLTEDRHQHEVSEQKYTIDKNPRGGSHRRNTLIKETLSFNMGSLSKQRFIVSERTSEQSELIRNSHDNEDTSNQHWLSESKRKLVDMSESSTIRSQRNNQKNILIHPNVLEQKNSYRNLRLNANEERSAIPFSNQLYSSNRGFRKNNILYLNGQYRSYRYNKENFHPNLRRSEEFPEISSVKFNMRTTENIRFQQEQRDSSDRQPLVNSTPKQFISAEPKHGSPKEMRETRQQQIASERSSYAIQTIKHKWENKKSIVDVTYNLRRQSQNDNRFQQDIRRQRYVVERRNRYIPEKRCSNVGQLIPYSNNDFIVSERMAMEQNGLNQNNQEIRGAYNQQRLMFTSDFQRKFGDSSDRISIRSHREYRKNIQLQKNVLEQRNFNRILRRNFNEERSTIPANVKSHSSNGEFKINLNGLHQERNYAFDKGNRYSDSRHFVEPESTRLNFATVTEVFLSERDISKLSSIYYEKEITRYASNKQQHVLTRSQSIRTHIQQEMLPQRNILRRVNENWSKFFSGRKIIASVRKTQPERRLIRNDQWLIHTSDKDILRSRKSPLTLSSLRRVIDFERTSSNRKLQRDTQHQIDASDKQLITSTRRTSVLSGMTVLDLKKRVGQNDPIIGEQGNSFNKLKFIKIEERFMDSFHYKPNTRTRQSRQNRRYERDMQRLGGGLNIQPGTFNGIRSIVSFESINYNLERRNSIDRRVQRDNREQNDTFRRQKSLRFTQSERRVRLNEDGEWKERSSSNKLKREKSEERQITKYLPDHETSLFVTIPSKSNNVEQEIQRTISYTQQALLRVQRVDSSEKQIFERHQRYGREKRSETATVQQRVHQAIIKRSNQVMFQALDKIHVSRRSYLDNYMPRKDLIVKKDHQELTRQHSIKRDFSSKFNLENSRKVIINHESNLRFGNQVLQYSWNINHKKENQVLSTVKPRTIENYDQFKAQSKENDFLFFSWIIKIFSTINTAVIKVNATNYLNLLNSVASGFKYLLKHAYNGFHNYQFFTKDLPDWKEKNDNFHLNLLGFTGICLIHLKKNI